MTDDQLAILNEHWRAVARLQSRIQAIVLAILAFVVISMISVSIQRMADVASLRRSQAQAAAQVAAIAATVEYLATEESARKAENERSKLDRAQLNARQAKAEADRRRIETALDQIAEIRAAVGRIEARKAAP